MEENGAVVWREIQNLDRHPVGKRCHQKGGHYRLEDEGSGRWFDFVVGPDSLKRFFFPAKQELLRTPLNGNGEIKVTEPVAPPKRAFLGARPCEIAAIKTQDKVMADRDPHYWSLRQNALFVVVQCVRPGDVCFCASMNTGPEAGEADLVLTELDATFVITARSAQGRHILSVLEAEVATREHLEEERKALAHAKVSMGRHLDTGDLPGLLTSNLNHPHWDDLGARCLSCSNCTMACPTCFCSAVEDHHDLLNQEAVRERRWDSCFSEGFSHMASGGIRPGPRERYRQWLTHKVDNWWEQFGSSGCVGCGRCVTWCPVGIDLTEDIPKFRETSP